ncbi:MAG: hypothetical protein HZT40_16760 [Candidatus Thiothrix singaporensis]|uniref:Secreted protein n=1 Tax=Candidatus Thiothrix singaporensis TaxID=2799669 RepID=A0A7L6AV03_9GAMM|nr:MAG: hypothetical protein HZT40_16760 [Candidatus Thiothrix singaporensis]
MKIIKIPVYVSIVGLLATLPAAYANEIVTNCAQVTAESAGETDSTPNNMVGMNPVEDDESCAKVMIPLITAMRQTLPTRHWMLVVGRVTNWERMCSWENVWMRTAACCKVRRRLTILTQARLPMAIALPEMMRMA